jgi:hypothetical protein
MSQVFVGNGRASLPERSESPSAAAEYSQIICDFTPVSPTRRHRLNPGCGYASMPPVGTPASAPNFTPCASGPQAVTTATSAATTPAVIPSAKP